MHIIGWFFFPSRNVQVWVSDCKLNNTMHSSEMEQKKDILFGKQAGSTRIWEQGFWSPVFIAKSTVCRTVPGTW